MSIRCAITGSPLVPEDGYWDDGEWISWDHINAQIGEIREGGLLEELIAVARAYLEDTGRHLPIYGQLGEQYAARRFGVELHANECAEGSDGRLGDALVEIKAISPLRDSRHVRVKASGNFDYLAIVKIDADFRIDAKLISRKKLGKSAGDYFVVSWEAHRSEEA